MSRVRGGQRLRRKLKRFPEEMTEEVKEEIEKGVRLVQKDAVRRVPVDQGDLKRGLSSKRAIGKKDKGLKWEFGIRGKKMQRDLFYARYVEYGTKGFTGTDRRGRQLRIPPMPERPFLRPALQRFRKGVRRRIDRALDRAFAKVDRS